jgi:hypothetical protein
MGKEFHHIGLPTASLQLGAVCGPVFFSLVATAARACSSLVAAAVALEPAATR